MHDFTRWSSLLRICGGVGVALGSIDPLEGAALILPGTGLLALGSYLAREERRTIAYRTSSFVLVALGVGALFGLSAIGGVGGSSGRSAWWALTIAPYVVGWSIDIWGPGLPRWISIVGIAIGVWYLAILGLILRSTPSAAHGQSMIPGIVLAGTGLATIVGCALRLRKRPPPPTTPADHATGGASRLS